MPIIKALRDNAKVEYYIGWSNYETWCVNLWLNNDGFMENLRRDKQTFKSVRELVDYLQNHVVTEYQPDLGCSMFSDLLACTIGHVNWYEIAQEFIYDNPECIESETRRG